MQITQKQNHLARVARAYARQTDYGTISSYRRVYAYAVAVFTIQFIKNTKMARARIRAYARNRSPGALAGVTRARTGHKQSPKTYNAKRARILSRDPGSKPVGRRRARIPTKPYCRPQKGTKHTMPAENRRAMMLVLAHATTLGLQDLVGTLFEQVENTNRLRKTLVSMQDFEDEAQMGMVVSPEGLKEAEAYLFSALDALIGALEPSEEDIKQMTGGDEKMVDAVKNLHLETRSRLADMRAKNLED